MAILVAVLVALLGGSSPPAPSVAIAQTFDAGRIGAQTQLVWGASRAWPGVTTIGYVTHLTVKTAAYGAWIRAHHPDWIEYRCDRRTPAWEWGSPVDFPIDFASPQVEAWLTTQFLRPLAAKGYSAVGFDNVFLFETWAGHRCGHYTRAGEWVQQYRDRTVDVAYIRDLVAWAARIRRVAHSLGLELAFNYIFQPTRIFSRALQQQLVDQADIWFDEGGFSALYVGGDQSAWSDRIRTILAHPGCYVSNNQVDTRSATARERVLANYLIVKSRCTYLALSGRQQYGVPLDFPELHVDVGAPQAPARFQNGWWIRPYAHATIAVDAGSYRIDREA